MDDKADTNVDISWDLITPNETLHCQFVEVLQRSKEDPTRWVSQSPRRHVKWPPRG
jgi:hypothetical protein